ncbi:MAG: thioredoxin family protein [Halobacteriales archaeon]|nr:thioredoxin family protein [Halobacteriales archaeon]
MVEMESASELEAGDPVPSFELPGADGETYRVDDFADADALLAVVTCNHCPYAVAKIPALNALAEEYDDVAVVGINPNDAEEYPDDSFERMREVVEDGTVRYDAYLRDESQDVARAFGATCTPDPFLFRRSNDGFELAYHGRLDDAMNPDEEPTGEPGFEMREHIESVLAGEPVEGDWQPSRGCSIKWKD